MLSTKLVRGQKVWSATFIAEHKSSLYPMTRMCTLQKTRAKECQGVSRIDSTTNRAGKVSICTREIPWKIGLLSHDNSNTVLSVKIGVLMILWL